MVLDEQCESQATCPVHTSGWAGTEFVAVKQGSVDAATGAVHVSLNMTGGGRATTCGAWFISPCYYRYLSEAVDGGPTLVHHLTSSVAQAHYTVTVDVDPIGGPAIAGFQPGYRYVRLDARHPGCWYCEATAWVAVPAGATTVTATVDLPLDGRTGDISVSARAGVACGVYVYPATVQSYNCRGTLDATVRSVTATF
jgi:hypothetical protein